MAAMRMHSLAGIGDVSAVCLGTMTWGNQNTEAEAHEQLDAFVAGGGNFIDTAELYPVPPGEEITCVRACWRAGRRAWLTRTCRPRTHRTVQTRSTRG
jgi:aryl-alcohol dehydrogenase-like predicted oxidoreductase